MKNCLLVLLILIIGQFVFAETPNGTDSKKVPNSLTPNFIASKNEVIFNENQIKIDVINPTAKNNKPASYLPGARGVNQFVIYTPSHGTRTSTNEFGAEAIVENNIVTEITGADTLIPPNGFVISGHGKAKDWINTNIKVGTKIYINKETLTLNAYTTSESYIFESQQKISETEKIIQYYRTINPAYNSKIPTSYIEDARNYLKKAIKKPDEVKKYSQLAIEASNDALKSVLPYRNDELKGVWLRPTEKTERAIEATLDSLKDAGINNIFLETFFHGKTIFPSQTMKAYGFTVQNEIFEELDPLKIWIKEAHKRGMKVHIWFETFYVGNQNPNDNPNSILAKNPSWGNKLKKDANSPFPSKSISEHNGYFLDPANTFVQDFLYKLIEEIIITYKPDGINIDYIRYPNNAPSSDGWGFTDFARDDFYSIYNIDPIYLKKTDANWQEWQNYKCEKITNFVKKVGQLGRQNKILITAVIFPNRENTLKTKHQDWRTWATRNFIDGFTPLFLTCDAKVANSMMNEISNNITQNTKIYAGLFVTFMNGSSEDLIRLIHEMRKTNAKGVILFDYAHLNNKYTDTLSKSVFAPKSQIKPNFTSTPEQTTVKKVRKGWWIFKK